MKKASDNTHLIVKPGVVLTPRIERVIISLDDEFKAAGLVAYVTSGKRDEVAQLNTIRKYCIRYKVDAEYPEILSCGVGEKDDDGYYKWQWAWSKLLNIGVIINPPKAAKVLLDYMSNGINKKGRIIPPSTHFLGGAFDIGGGIDQDISNELEVVKKAFEKKLPGLKSFLPERKNNCVHCETD